MINLSVVNVGISPDAILEPGMLVTLVLNTQWWNFYYGVTDPINQPTEIVGVFNSADNNLITLSNVYRVVQKQKNAITLPQSPFGTTGPYTYKLSSNPSDLGYIYIYPDQDYVNISRKTLDNLTSTILRKRGCKFIIQDKNDMSKYQIFQLTRTDTSHKVTYLNLAVDMVMTTVDELTNGSTVNVLFSYGEVPGSIVPLASTANIDSVFTFPTNSVICWSLSNSQILYPLPDNYV